MTAEQTDKTRCDSGIGPEPAGTGLIKANSLRLGGYGLLLIGAAGAGKSALTLALLERAALFGRTAALIGDDYSRLRRENGALYAESPPHIAGALEIRGAGVFQMPYEPFVRLDLAVELAGEGERYPQGRSWHWPPAAQVPGARQKTGQKQGAGLPLLKLPQAGKADMTALCQAIEARLFKTAYIGRKF
ncbi:MAG: hypothetical protein DU429_05305 [Candidatus Tokpelaia sp.]|nr:MAG: hypothetical protein DU430_07745 [Candidatus Tokpelaia sp.]KAA6206875.1 MAG: hypothetical protein DU429_05305 [Candidatus Tokpelaia sp.]